jgi:hypothetical protein
MESMSYFWGLRACAKVERADPITSEGPYNLLRRISPRPLHRAVLGTQLFVSSNFTPFHHWRLLPSGHRSRGLTGCLNGFTHRYANVSRLTSSTRSRASKVAYSIIAGHTSRLTRFIVATSSIDTLYHRIALPAFRFTSTRLLKLLIVPFASQQSLDRPSSFHCTTRLLQLCLPLVAHTAPPPEPPTAQKWTTVQKPDPNANSRPVPPRIAP